MNREIKQQKRNIESKAGVSLLDISETAGKISSRTRGEKISFVAISFKK